jgi:hypothetical protein
VWGAVYEISANDLERLDRCEGFPWQYNRIRKHVLVAGRRRVVWVYELVEDTVSLPSGEYVNRIAYGYTDHGLDLEALLAAVAQTVTEFEQAMEEDDASVTSPG